MPTGDAPADLRGRLLAKVAIDPETECWEWTGNRTDRNYGSIKIEGRQTRAHRASYEAHIGPIPDGLVVCHRCDNPPCINPDHLFIGTQSDNVRDMYAKGRGHNRTGENSAVAVLTEDDVRMIRALRTEGLTYKAIGERLNVSLHTAFNVVSGRCWGHVC